MIDLEFSASSNSTINLFHLDSFSVHELAERKV